PSWSRCSSDAVLFRERFFAGSTMLTAENLARRGMSKDDLAGVGKYDGAAAGWGALEAVAKAVRGQMGVARETHGLLTMNQPQGFDCPGCAWPDPKHTSSFEFCENGAKAVAFELTSRRVTQDFFATHAV